jgi:hypothetical protein
MSYITTSEVTMRGDVATYGFSSYRYNVVMTAESAGSVKRVEYTNLIAQSLQVSVALRRAQVINQEISYIQRCATNRQSALAELGKCLAEVAHKEADCEKITDETTIPSWVCSDLVRYVATHINIGSKLPNYATQTKYTGGDLQIMMQYIQIATETISNDLDQDSVRLQSIFSKANDAYELASKLMKKFSQATESNVSTIAQ